MFDLDEEDSKKFTEWDGKHKKGCDCYHNPGAIGGRLTFSFTPTGLGCITVIKCACGEKLDLTDYDSW